MDREVSNDINNMGSLFLVDVPCNLCGSDVSRPIFATRDYRYRVDDTEFQVVKCSKCGLVRTNPRPSQADIHRYYNDDFYQMQETPEEALERMKPRAIAMARHVNRYPCGRMLDIGCFHGEFMKYMSSTSGWDVAGIEFSRRPTNYYDLNIFYGHMADAPFEPGSFDVVTLWAVLEHVYDPNHTLHEVHRFLKPGGVAIILVPNFNSLPARFMHHDDVPRHLTMFTRRTLARMLRNCSLDPIEWSCSQDLCGGSVRGWLNYLVKRLSGEAMGDIQAQNRSLDRWGEFAGMINGRSNRLMLKVDRFDIWLAQYLDRTLDALGLGFIMTVHARKM